MRDCHRESSTPFRSSRSRPSMAREYPPLFFAGLGLLTDDYLNMLGALSAGHDRRDDGQKHVLDGLAPRYGAGRGSIGDLMLELGLFGRVRCRNP
jgi:hypothetical protein